MDRYGLLQLMRRNPWRAAFSLGALVLCVAVAWLAVKPHALAPGHAPSALPSPTAPGYSSAAVPPRPEDHANSAHGAAPARSANHEDALRDEIEKAVHNLSNGHVAFNHPKQSHVGRTDTIQVELSRELSAGALAKLITMPGDIEKYDIKVGNDMQATLSGGGAFVVTPSGPQTHWVSDDGPTSWTWSVTPKLTGVQYLVLTIDAIITINGRTDTYNVRTLTEPIEIVVGWPQTFGEWLEYGKKTAGDIGWLWAPIAGAFALIVGWWKKRPKRDFT